MSWEALTPDRAKAVAEAILNAVADELERLGVPFSEAALRDVLRIGPHALIYFALNQGLPVEDSLSAIHDGIVRGVGDRADVRIVRMEGQA